MVSLLFSVPKRIPLPNDTIGFVNDCTYHKPEIVATVQVTPPMLSLRDTGTAYVLDRGEKRHGGAL